MDLGNDNDQVCLTQWNKRAHSSILTEHGNIWWLVCVILSFHSEKTPREKTTREKTKGRNDAKRKDEKTSREKTKRRYAKYAILNFLNCLFTWYLFFFSHGVFSTFRLACFKFIVCPHTVRLHGVISSSRKASFRLFALHLFMFLLSVFSHGVIFAFRLFMWCLFVFPVFVRVEPFRLSAWHRFVFPHSVFSFYMRACVMPEDEEESCENWNKKKRNGRKDAMPKDENTPSEIWKDATRKDAMLKD